MWRRGIDRAHKRGAAVRESDHFVPDSLAVHPNGLRIPTRDSSAIQGDGLGADWFTANRTRGSHQDHRGRSHHGLDVSDQYNPSEDAARFGWFASPFSMAATAGGCTVANAKEIDSGDRRSE